MKRVLFLALLGAVLITCTHRWIAVPQNIRSFELCKSLNNGPQMLKVSQFKSAVIIVRDCSAMDEERVSIAMHIFLKKWKEQFPHNVVGNERVEGALNSLSTEFSGAKKTANAYTIDGTYGKGLTVSGLALAPGWIWVRIRPGERLCQTSFVHELVHVAIWALKGSDGDPDHLGDKYSGWKMDHNILIQDTNQTLCDWGI